MMSDLPEQDFSKAFDKVFGGRSFGSQDKLEERHQRERKASRTLKQRQRTAKRTAALNVRVEPSIKDQINKMAKAWSCSQADVIHRLVEAESQRNEDA